MQYTDAHKQLAKAIMDTHAAREASYVRDRDSIRYGGYALSIHEATEQTAPAELFEPVSCLLTAGYGEIFDWCERVLKA